MPYGCTIKIIIDRLLLLFGPILNECTNVMQESQYLMGVLPFISGFIEKRTSRVFHDSLTKCFIKKSESALITSPCIKITHHHHDFDELC